MSLKREDGNFLVGYWFDPESEDEEDASEYADTLDELRARAIKVLSKGRYKYAILYRWVKDDWIELEQLPEKSFWVGYWLDPESEGKEDASEHADTLDELRARAIKVLSEGRYKYAILYRWVKDDWVELEQLPEENHE